MTVDEVKARVEKIRSHAQDNERAHGEEDDLHQDVLKAIAEGAANARGLAAAALSTEHIDFSRWYA